MDIMAQLVKKWLFPKSCISILCIRRKELIKPWTNTFFIEMNAQPLYGRDFNAINVPIDYIGDIIMPFLYHLTIHYIMYSQSVALLMINMPFGYIEISVCHKIVCSACDSMRLYGNV